MCVCMHGFINVYLCTHVRTYACMHVCACVTFMYAYYACFQACFMRIAHAVARITSEHWGARAAGTPHSSCMSSAHDLYACMHYEHNKTNGWGPRRPVHAQDAATLGPSDPLLKPHETTMKPLMKPLDFYHTFHETGGFYKYFIYLLETFIL